MKRELKLEIGFVNGNSIPYCRAYPDEKGIETQLSGSANFQAGHCRAYPDEKGIETYTTLSNIGGSTKLQSLSR